MSLVSQNRYRCPNECKTNPCPVFPESQSYFLKEKAWCDEEYRERYYAIEHGGCTSHSDFQISTEWEIEKDKTDKFNSGVEFGIEFGRSDERKKLIDKIISGVERQRKSVSAYPQKVEALSLAIDVVESFRKSGDEQ